MFIKHQKSKVMNVQPVGADNLGGQTEFTKPIFVSTNFAITHKSYIHKTSYTTCIQNDSPRS